MDGDGIRCTCYGVSRLKRCRNFAIAQYIRIHIRISNVKCDCLILAMSLSHAGLSRMSTTLDPEVVTVKELLRDFQGYPTTCILH